MSWFQHKHYWYAKDDAPLGKVQGSDEKTIASYFILEGCYCGAVRTITIEPGKPPVIREGKGE